MGGFGDIKGGPALKDSDADGIRDDWESAHGLDPHDPHGGNKLAADGHTMLETYLQQPGTFA